MFPALPEPLEIEALPEGVNSRTFTSIEPLLPALVRKSAQGDWNVSVDYDVAALQVFDELDGVHSFYFVSTLAALAAVAAFMTRNQTKPRAAYFFVLPEELAAAYVLPVSAAGVVDSNCPPLQELHRHVLIGDDRKEPLFREIQNRQLFNYRVCKPTIDAMVRLLREQNCRDYESGQCASCDPEPPEVAPNAVAGAIG